MGYRGKLEERQRARELRSQSWTLKEIAAELDVSKSSVSRWVADVDFEPRPRQRRSGPHPLALEKQREIERCRVDAERTVGAFGDRDLTMFALGLYAGEGGKTQECVSMANTNPVYLRLFVEWLRRTFDVDERRMRAKLYLHAGLDLEAASAFWSEVLTIPRSQFGAPHIAPVTMSAQHPKHVFGCATVRYSCSHTHRRVMALIEAVASPFALPG